MSAGDSVSKDGTNAETFGLGADGDLDLSALAGFLQTGNGGLGGSGSDFAGGLSSSVLEASLASDESSGDAGAGVGGADWQPLQAEVMRQQEQLIGQSLFQQSSGAADGGEDDMMHLLGSMFSEDSSGTAGSLGGLEGLGGAMPGGVAPVGTAPIATGAPSLLSPTALAAAAATASLTAPGADSTVPSHTVLDGSTLLSSGAGADPSGAVSLAPPSSASLTAAEPLRLGAETAPAEEEAAAAAEASSGAGLGLGSGPEAGAAGASAPTSHLGFTPTLPLYGPGQGVWAFVPFSSNTDPSLHPTNLALQGLGDVPPPKQTTGGRMSASDTRRVATVHASQLYRSGVADSNSLFYLQALRCKRAHVQQGACRVAAMMGNPLVGPPPPPSAALVMPLTTDVATAMISHAQKTSAAISSVRVAFAAKSHSLGQSAGGDTRRPRQLLKLDAPASVSSKAAAAAATASESKTGGDGDGDHSSGLASGSSRLWSTRGAVDAVFQAVLELSDARLALDSIRLKGRTIAASEATATADDTGVTTTADAVTAMEGAQSRIEQLQRQLANVVGIHLKSDAVESPEAEEESAEEAAASLTAADAAVSLLLGMPKGKRLLVRCATQLKPEAFRRLLLVLLRLLPLVVCSEVENRETLAADEMLASSVCMWISSLALTPSQMAQGRLGAVMGQLTQLVEGVLDCNEAEVVAALLEHAQGAKVMQVVLTRGEKEFAVLSQQVLALGQAKAASDAQAAAAGTTDASAKEALDKALELSKEWQAACDGWRALIGRLNDTVEQASAAAE